MMKQTEKNQHYLHLKTITWYKDSHSLFDYESSKITPNNFDFPLTHKTICIYRKRDTSEVIAVDQSESFKYENQAYQLLSRFNTQPVTDKKIKINFNSENQHKLNKKLNQNDRLNTDQSNSSDFKTEEDPFLIVRKLKKQNGDYLGYKMQPGNIIKIGRVEFFVSQVSLDGKVTMANGKNKARVYASRKVMKCNPKNKKITSTPENKNQDKPQCKICLQETQDQDNFLFNPCVCAGSCGTVHLECLTQWIHFKVKKQVVGGTQHYNFEKFNCQVCKHELPMILQIQGAHKQLLPIQKPTGDYLVLQGACDKQKSVIMIQNIPTEGIKIGRGHECEIRITDISVSRNHGSIKKQNDGFYIYDNKSKFGTLIRAENMSIELGRMSQGIQIGRTVIAFQLRKEGAKDNHNTQKNIKSSSKDKIVAKNSTQF